MMEKITRQRENKEIDTSTVLIEILYEYLRHWKWFIAAIALALVIAVGLILVTPREYKPSLSILLNEDKSTKSASSEYVDLEALGFLSTTNNIENEIIVLTSPDLMDMVVDALKLNIRYYKKSLFRDIEIYKETPFQVSVIPNSKSFSGMCNLYIRKGQTGYDIEGEYSKGNNTIEISLSNQDLSEAIVLNETTSLVITLTGKEVEEGEKYYIEINNAISTTSNLVSKLSVVNAGQKSSVLNLSILVNNTQKGIDILNELTHQYNELNLKINNEIAYNTALFINDRLKDISIELSDAEEEVVEYKQQHKITDLSSEAQLFVSQTGENELRLLEVETQLNVLKFIQDFINNPENQTKIIPNMGITDVGLSQIISEYNNKLLASDQLLKGTGEKNPARVRVLEELANMRGGIASSLVNVRETYTVSRDDFKQRSYVTQSRIRSVPKQEKGLIEKVREQKIKENLFLFLMQKREETNLSIAATAGKARVVVSPRSNILPVAPKSKIIILAFAILGLLVPIIVIYVRNLFKTKISNRDEFERLARVSIIGEVATNKTGEYVVVNNQHSAISEMFRSLRNNIRFTSRKKEGLAIMITSTVANEGKSFVSINLALSFAYTGKKVLLIGGDIRNPKIHDYLNSDSSRSRKGLSDYLVDEGSDWNKYLFTPYSEVADFDVLTAGTIPPNPNELLMTPLLKELIEEAQAKYDYVIIDSAPVGLVSDSYLIGEHVDLTLYVVRENKTPKAAINFINMQLDENKLKNIYVVLNDTELKSSYKYGYGKAYGYGKK